jgi:hypothetical protein
MIAAFAALLALQATPVPAYWDELKPGPHAVGFTQRWTIDSTRRLPGGARYGLRFRPLLMNIWYPARASKAKPQPYADYFTGAIRAAFGSGVDGYAPALVKYQRETAWFELARTEQDSTEPELARRIGALLRAPSYARRDAPRARLSGRVVVYTSGSGSSMDDNVVLCEYLASHGYTVIGSAFPSEDSSFATSLYDRSRPRDIARLLMELPRHGFPVQEVMAIGHSSGAQALQWYATDPSAPIDAILSLDTTQDYAMLSDNSWAYTKEMIRERRAVHIPIMFVADRTALFELADSLAWTRRTLVTLPPIGHNDFISQGNIRQQLMQGLPGSDSAARVTAARSYRALVEYIRHWIRAFPDSTPAATGPLSTLVLPLGEKFPPRLTDSVGTARELRHLFATAGAEEFAQLAIAARQGGSGIASNSVLMMIMVDAIRRGAPERARAAYRNLLGRDSTVGGIPAAMESRAKLFASFGAKEIASEWRTLRKALVE